MTSLPMTEASPTAPRQTKSRHARKPTLENWDDDFEYAGPSKPKAVPAKPKKEGNPNVPGRSSPTESVVSSWDDSPPRSTPSASLCVPEHYRSLSRSAGNLHLGPPRHSPSHSPSLPSPISKARHQSLAAPSSFVLPEISRSRSGSTSASVARKLIRHPSTSFLPTTQPGPSTSSLNLVSGPNRSSPHLPRSTSSERMPPPALPMLSNREPGKGNQKIRNEGVRVSGIPFSSKQETLREIERKPSLWKRFSGKGSSERYTVEAEGDHPRRRNTSIGSPASPESRSHPPTPPLPLNLRSTSAASGKSDISVHSQLSASSASASNRSGPTSALSSILRRSTSSLSRRSDNSGKTPPSSYTPVMATSPLPPSPLLQMPQQQPSFASSPTQPSFSRGFHLPSPTPGSPYAEPAPIMPKLPHSSSFPGPYHKHSDAGTETEHEEDGVDATPKRRKKMRPVSALPTPRSISRGWNAAGWSGFGDLPTSQTSYHRPTASDLPTSSSAGVINTAGSRSNSNTYSHVRRLSSFSKKHGRRLSGGFKFGTGSSTSSTEQNETRHGSKALETVTGSPSKPNRSPSRKEIPSMPQFTPDELPRQNIRLGSISASSSAFKSDTVGTEGQSSTMAANLHEDAMVRKLEKAKRRQSWGEFVIPKDVMDKQKGIKKDIGALKKIPVHIEAVKSLLASHAAIFERIRFTGSAEDRDEFRKLEEEYEQWWEVAETLIDVASTGIADPGHPSASPAQSRRITMTRDESNTAAEALQRLSLGQPQREGTRSASLPDPEVDLGPPRADPPEHWRASTGRQDMINRRRQVLQTIISPTTTRPGMIRGSSTVSVSSSNGVLSGQRSAGARTPVDQSISGGAFSSPSEFDYFIPSASLPSPQTASSLVQPSPPPKLRYNNKKKLAGVINFLRALKTSSSNNRRSPPIWTAVVTSTPNAHISPSIPSTPPSTFGFDDVQYPTAQSSCSAMIPDAASPPLKRQPSPQKQGKRPSIRNIFRSSSGNWSDLVKNANSSAPAPVPPLPGRKSIESGSEREEIPGMPYRAMLRHSSSQMVKHNKTHTSTSFNLPNKGWKSPKQKSKSPDLYDYAECEQGTLSKTTSRQFSRNSRSSDSNGIEVDRTVRPARKSRILGLGMPNSPSSPSFSRPQSSQPSVNVPASKSRSVSNTSGTSAVSGFSEVSKLSGVTGTTGISSASSAMRGSSETTAASGSGKEDHAAGTLQIAPEHLPALLEYLEQCEEQLGEWKNRAQGIFGNV